jgi:hypothetical protein
MLPTFVSCDFADSFGAANAPSFSFGKAPLSFSETGADLKDFEDWTDFAACPTASQLNLAEAISSNPSRVDFGQDA